MVYETVCPSPSNSIGNSYNSIYSNSYSRSKKFHKRRRKRTVALVRNLIKAKQNLWSRKKQFVRNILGINNRGRRVQHSYTPRRPYQSTAISRPVHYQGMNSTYCLKSQNSHLLQVSDFYNFCVS